MPYNIIVGRTEADKKLFGEGGVILLGKGYVRMGRTTSLSNNILLDVNRSHVIMVTGKRGSGKSYSLSVITEGMVNLPGDISKNLTILIFDTMGIFWTMKFPNEKDAELLKQWGFEPRGIGIEIFTPAGFYDIYKKQGIPTDKPFSIRPDELTAEDWYLAFGLNMNDPVAILIEKIVYGFREKKRQGYSIDDMLKAVDSDTETGQDVKNAAKNRFRSAKGWGLFHEHGTKITDLIRGGKATVLDVSCYATLGGWGVKNLVIGLVSKKIFLDRMEERKKEEISTIKSGLVQEGRRKPLVWLVLDEAHEAMPDTGKTAATDSLITILREGRQPGVSLLLATQQPGKIHRDVITQADLIISHRVTAKPDIEALNEMMQSYLLADIMSYLNNLPKETGAAIILDDTSERIYPIRVRPKLSWHGGEAPTAITPKRRLLL